MNRLLSFNQYVAVRSLGTSCHLDISLGRLPTQLMLGARPVKFFGPVKKIFVVVLELIFYLHHEAAQALADHLIHRIIQLKT